MKGENSHSYSSVSREWEQAGSVSNSLLGVSLATHSGETKNLQDRNQG